MKALILAAGIGSRLRPLTDNMPKCLTEVNGVPIIHKQIQNLLDNGIDDITIISGYLSNVLEKDIKSKWPFIKIIESVDYLTTNNMYSAYLGIKNIGLDDTLIMMNADVFFDSSVLTSLIKEPTGAIVVDVGTYNEESMKVVVKDNKIVDIAKTISKEDAYGCSIDVYKFNPNELKAFYNKCVDYILNQKILNKWSEVALKDILLKTTFKVCALNGRWLEIDNFEDLRNAEVLFR